MLSTPYVPFTLEDKNPALPSNKSDDPINGNTVYALHYNMIEQSNYSCI